MNNLTQAEKLQLIKELTEKHNITAYEIGEKTELNTSGVHRILSGDIQNPREKTLNTILTYIENKLAGIQASKDTRPPDLISQASIQQLIAVEVVKALQPQLNEFKSYSDALMRAASHNALDNDEMQDKILKLTKEITDLKKIIKKNQD